MERGVKCCDIGFFLPLGGVASLENDIQFLSEYMSYQYDVIMKMPYSRRKRFIEDRYEIERKRANSTPVGKPRGRR